MAIEGVGVYNKTTGGYTYTNVSGYFELDDVSVGDVIYFYSLGFKNHQLTITEDLLDSTVKILLEDSVVSLDLVGLVTGGAAVKFWMTENKIVGL